MNTYKIEDFTNGVELEMADVDTRIELPLGNTWDYKDYTVANSNGICCDPKKELTIFGGEVNTVPCWTVHDQVGNIANIFSVLKPIINHTTNLHVHVRAIGLHEDLPALKKLAKYIHKYQTAAFNIVERIPRPSPFEHPTFEEYQGAMRRYNRRNISHQKKMTRALYFKLRNAKTPREFYEAHASRDKFGRPMFHLATRCGINLMQLFDETDTVEFRHFPMTLDLDEIRSAITWCLKFMEAGLNDQQPPKELLEDWMVFPKFIKYNHVREERMRSTSVGKINRSRAKANITKMLKSGIIKERELYGE